MTEHRRVNHEEAVVRVFGREIGYWTCTVFVLVYNLGLALTSFALLRVIFPVEDSPLFGLAVFAVQGLALLSSVGVVLHMISRRPCLARWAYLLTFGAASISFWSLVLGGELTWQGRTGIALLILAGSLVAISMHIQYGGRQDPSKKIRDGREGLR